MRRSYKLILFDLDGTLLDTSPGIEHCYNTALKAFGLPEVRREELRQIIGGKLPQNFRSRFNVPEERVSEAVAVYRGEYAKNGILMAEHYGGMTEMLSELKSGGKLLAAATLKREDFAVTMLESFGIARYMNVIIGMDSGDVRTKASIIGDCLERLGCSAGEAVLVGDSSGDAEGAREAGVDFYAVTYGWGFTEKEEAVKAGALDAFGTVEELREALII